MCGTNEINEKRSNARGKSVRARRQAVLQKKKKKEKKTQQEMMTNIVDAVCFRSAYTLLFMCSIHMAC